MNELLGYDRDFLREKNGLNTAIEIAHQPRLWADLSKNILESEAKDFLVPILEKTNIRVILTGAGTSAFSGYTIAPYLNKKRDFDVEAISTTDIVSCPEYHLEKDRSTLIVSFARSGNSPESSAAVSIANDFIDDCYHLILTCNSNGDLFHYSNTVDNAFSVIMPEGSNDKSFAMTSSFTCMTMAALYFLDDISNEKFTKNIEDLASRCEKEMNNWAGVSKEISTLDYNRLVVIGSGCFSGLAREASLKSLELSAGKVMTSYDTSLGFRHGPKFIINEKTLVLGFISSDEYTRKYDLDLIDELVTDNVAQKIIVMDNKNNNRVNVENIRIGGIGVDEIWLLFPYILFSQLLAFEKSLSLGFSPDNPCPTGEVNRVVQGVNIYKYN